MSAHLLPAIKARQVIKVLKKLEFEEVRQKGSHVFFQHADGRVTVVPVHRGEDLGRGLLRQIIRDIEIQPKEFLNLL